MATGAPLVYTVEVKPVVENAVEPLSKEATMVVPGAGCPVAWFVRMKLKEMTP